jgi:hypothetical protein
MLFYRESEMASPVRNWLYKQHLEIKQEFTLPWGVCDFVGVSFKASQVSKRITSGQHRAIGPLRRVELLRQIPETDSGESISLSRLTEVYGTGHITVSIHNDLDNLLAGKFIVRCGTEGFQKVNGWAPLHKRVVAVELKLQRVSEALAQAASNRAFATESYVAFPVAVAKRVLESAREKEFVQAGVGILEVQCSNCRVKLKARPCVSETNESLQMHCVERFWQTKGNSSLAVGQRVPVFDR